MASLEEDARVGDEIMDTDSVVAILPDTVVNNVSEDIEEGEVRDFSPRLQRLDSSDHLASIALQPLIVGKDEDEISEQDKTLTEQELSDLYASVGVDPSDAVMHRLHALHMRGTQDMSTEDIFSYFSAFKPASIEWINDVSCNVLWVDAASAAQALLGLTGTSSPEPSEEDEGRCRVGVEHPKARRILLRFSLMSDKKSRQAEKSSDYYKRHGNPNFGGIKGLLTESHKRRYRREDPVEPRTNPDSRTRLPRMRMYADDEEAKISRRKVHRADLRSRLHRERSSSEDEPIASKRFAGDLRSKLNSKPPQLGIELDSERYYELIASE